MDESIEKDIRDRVAQLPQVVQDAISSADTTARLRELSELHKLHLDQWEILQTQVMLTLLAFQEVEDLPDNIEKNIGVSHDDAVALAADISRIIFEPIREELERQLDNPNAQVESGTGVENLATQVLDSEHSFTSASTATTPPPAPIAPPPTPPDTKAVRAPISEAYKPGEASTLRKDVHSDPYREQPV